MVELGDTRTPESVTAESLPAEAPESGAVAGDARAAAAPAAPGSGPPSSGAALVGQTLGGRYRVTSLIGSGGMGAVYKAEHTDLQKIVALKVLNAEMATHREAALRFEREALVSARIAHPHVVSATDSGRLADGSLYLVLEYVDGNSLRELINSEGRLPLARALNICAQIADALGAAHAQSIVHRDLKPGNVMLLSHDGNPEFVKVLDFGLARMAGEATPGEPLTRTGSIFGTPEYMAPEQARGEVVDGRADLYALGVILYELLGGKPPFQSSELVAILIKHIQEAPPPLPADVPAPLAAYVLSLLEKQPDRRPADARQVAKALRRMLPASPVPSTVPPRAPETRLDRGGVRPLLDATRDSLAGRLARVDWAGLGRRSGVWWRRLAKALAYAGSSLWGGSAWLVSHVAPRWIARARQLWAERRGLLAGVLGVVIGFVGVSAWLFARSSAELARARQGEPAALNQIAATPVEERSEEAALALAMGYLSSGQTERGLDALTELVAEYPELAEHPEVLRGVLAAVNEPTTRDRALELAAKRLGGAGVDLLFHVWWSIPEKTPATRAARTWLDTPEVRAKAKPGVALALDLRETRSCSAVQALLGSAAAEAVDERSLLPLERLQKESGCGFLGLEDCWSCLREDPALLEKVLAAAKQRPAPEF